MCDFIAILINKNQTKFTFNNNKYPPQNSIANAKKKFIGEYLSWLRM